MDLGISPWAVFGNPLSRNLRVSIATMEAITPGDICFRNEIPPGVALIALRVFLRVRETGLPSAPSCSFRYYHVQ